MSKAWRNFWTDAVLFLQVSALAATGVILKWVLPPGSGGGHGWGGGWGHASRGWGWGHEGFGPRTLMGMTRHEWGDVHFWISMSLVAMLLLHLVLHWRWIVCRVKALIPGRSRGEPRCEDDERMAPEVSSFRPSSRPSGAAGFHRP